MANSYCSPFDLMVRLSIPEDDTREGQLINIVEAASRWVDHQTSHRFYTVTETRYYNAASRPQLWPWSLDALESAVGYPGRVEIDDFVSVTSVATDEDGDGVYERTWTVGTDYWLGPRNAPANGQPYRYINRNPVSGRYLFPLFEQAVAVTGACGYCTLANRPGDIRELTLQVAEQMARPVLAATMAGVSTYKLADELTVTMGSSQLPQQAQDILMNYRGFMGLL